METRDIDIDVSFEHLFTTIYGKRYLCAGKTSFSSFKKGVNKLIRTLKQAIDKNVQGDEAHLERILKHFEDFESYSKGLKSKDELFQRVLLLLFRTQFELIGRMPENWEPGRTKRAHNSKYLNLSDYRVLYYVRTPEQKVNEMINYAYKLPNKSEGDLFHRLIEIRQKHPKDHKKVLNWIKSNEPETYQKFNKS